MARLRVATQRLERWMWRNPFFVLLGICSVLAALIALSPTTYTLQIPAPTDQAAQIGFGDTRSVGQSFQAPYGLSRIVIPLQADSQFDGPLLLHLRENYFGEDIRTSSIFSVENGEAVFVFRPLRRPPTRLIWVLEAPHHPDRSFFINREIDAAAFPQGQAYIKGKAIGGNFGFTLFSTRPLITRLFNLRLRLDGLRGGEGRAVVGGLLGALAVLVVWPRLRIRQQHVWPAVIGIVIVSISLHVFFAYKLPLINDEGAYLQDAKQSSVRLVPFRDFLTKGPLYIAALKVWQAVTPHSFIAWRAFSALVWAGAAILIGMLAKRLRFSPPQQIGAVLLLALLPAAITLTTPLLLQTLSVPIVLAGLVVLLRGIEHKRYGWIAAAALLMAAAYLVRASSAVGAIVGALFILTSSRQRLPAMSVYAGSGIITGALLFLAGWFGLGLEKTAVLFNVEAAVISHQRTLLASGAAAEPFIRQLTEQAGVLWQSGTWLLLGLFLLPIIIVARTRLAITAAVILGWTLVVMSTYFHLADMNWLLPGSVPLKPIEISLIVFAVPIFVLAIQLLRGRHGPSSMAEIWKWLIPAGAWLLLLVLLYGRWGRFRSNYLTEFLPPLSLIASWSIVNASRVVQWLPARSLRRGVIGVGVFLFVASYLLQWEVAVRYPYTGTIPEETAVRVASLIRQHVPPGTPIFTAQPIFTVLAGRPIMFGYSHPGWLRDAYLGNVPEELRRLYFKNDSDITAYLRDEARFVLADRRTDEIYFDFYPERTAILQNQFALVAQEENSLGGESILLYRRK